MSQLIPHITATRLAAVYQVETARIRELIVELGEHTAVLKEAFSLSNAYTGSFGVTIEVNGSRCESGPKAAEEVLKAMKQSAWRALIEKLDILKVMSSKRQSELKSALYDSCRSYHGHGDTPPKDLPEITEDTIMAVLSGMVQSAPEFLAEAIAEEYDWLRPGVHQQSKYATNRTDRIGRKVIKGWTVQHGYGSDWRPTYTNEKHLRAIDWIFHSLAGQGIPREHDGPLCAAIKTCGKDGVGETEFFRFKCFKNQNLHIEFKRLDLLEEFNKVAGNPSRVGEGR